MRRPTSKGKGRERREGKGKGGLALVRKKYGYSPGGSF